MRKPPKKQKELKPGTRSIRLPKDALNKINLGHSFAEYDPILLKPNVFVETPAIVAARDEARAKCFFVGRRGTGKTGTTYFLENRQPDRTIRLLPQISAYKSLFNLEELGDLRQQPFKSLVSSFKRALQDEVLGEWLKRNVTTYQDLNANLTIEREYVEYLDFDERVMAFVEDLFGHLRIKNSRDWVRQSKRTNEITREMSKLAGPYGWDFIVLIDRIDEAWDGSDEAVILLMALMHACVELNASDKCIRPLLFLRENIFERVRAIDNEFSRLETSVVSMDWTRQQLLEMIERRLNLPFNTKLPLGGDTWDYFFESSDGVSSQSYVFDYCQERPRDVLIFCTLAVESAQSRRQERITLEDLQAARRRFSDSRLKDLGDEYAENYPQLKYVLSNFHGLGREYTLGGIEAFLEKLLSNHETLQLCGSWIYSYNTPDQFLALMYNIGFFGIRSKDKTQFRTLGSESSTPPPITAVSIAVVHPSYVDALNLQNTLVTTLHQDARLRQAGIVHELPNAISLLEYQEQLQALSLELKDCPTGDEHASQYEDIVGRVIKLCFYRSLTNVEPHERDYEGRVVRDWIASNRADSGFWAIVRMRYGATQVVWECKNFVDLSSQVVVVRESWTPIIAILVCLGWLEPALATRSPRTPQA